MLTNIVLLYVIHQLQFPLWCKVLVVGAMIIDIFDAGRNSK